jgi:hypothetical protein
MPSAVVDGAGSAGFSVRRNNADLIKQENDGMVPADYR